jgi:tetratricopeptide (TPR) repeat protein
MLRTFSLILFFFLFSFLSRANDSIAQKDIHTLCKTDLVQCHEMLPAALEQVKPKSFHWFRLKMYQVTTYFQFKPVVERIKLVEPLLEITSAPANFKLTVYIDWAKSQYFEGNHEVAIEYADKAIKLASELTEPFDNPLLYVQLFNIQTYKVHAMEKLGREPNIEQYRRNVYQELLSIYDKYQRITDIEFHKEAQVNLGHLMFHVGETEASVKHYLTSADWAIKQGNSQQAGIGYFNAARAYQNAKQYRDASSFFVLALQHFGNANNQSYIHLTYFRLAQVHRDDNKFEKALQYFSMIDKQHLRISEYENYDKMALQSPFKYRTSGPKAAI